MVLTTKKPQINTKLADLLEWQLIGCRQIFLIKQQAT